MVLSFYFNSRADAPIMGHVWEHTLAEDVFHLGMIFLLFEFGHVNLSFLNIGSI